MPLEPRFGLFMSQASKPWLQVRDDGPGLPTGVRPGSAATSLGFQLVPLLAEQLGASLQLADGPGACFDIDFHPGAAP